MGITLSAAVGSPKTKAHFPATTPQHALKLDYPTQLNVFDKWTNLPIDVARTNPQ
jgi:hypothetical protein